MDAEEFTHIAASVLTISFAFTYAREVFHFGRAGFDTFATSFLSILFTVGLGFVLHELGHRHVARKYGCYAAYRAFTWGLVLALVMAFTVGIVFAAPGAVFIIGPHLGRRENGRIAVAGPLVNALLAFAFWVVAVTVPGLREVASLGQWVNAFLGAFNLLPFDPLDGGKVVRWGTVPWVLAFMACVAVGFLPV